MYQMGDASGNRRGMRAARPEASDGRSDPALAGRYPDFPLGQILPRHFYARPVLQVARACIGKIVVRACGEGVAAGKIVEAEACRGPEDLAAHSAGGRRTS